MISNLKKIGVIEKDKLSGELYFQSLLEQGYPKGLFSGRDIERLQNECLAFLAHKVECFNAGDSCSIRVEKAQEIMASIMFTIGLWLKTYQNPDDAITAVRNEPITELYQKGRKRINTLLTVTKAIHAKLLHHLIVSPNVFYRSTIEGGILGFFKLYNPDFSAQEIHITADYPLFISPPKLAGVEFIKAYVEAAYCENMFCSYFPSDDIHHLLCGYEKDYQELLLNIYEQVLTAAIGCIIAGTDAHGLDISGNGTLYLKRLFVGKTKTEILAVIQNAAHALKRIFSFPIKLDLYVQRSLSFIADITEIAMREQSPGHVFYAPIYPEYKPKLCFPLGDKMDNGKYRKVVNEIIQCRFLQDKIAIINEHIHSFADLEDVLSDAQLTHKEIMAVLNELSLPEVAALSNKYSIISEVEAFDFRKQEQVMRECLRNYVSALPKEKLELLIITSEAIDWV